MASANDPDVVELTREERRKIKMGLKNAKQAARTVLRAEARRTRLEECPVDDLRRKHNKVQARINDLMAELQFEQEQLKFIDQLIAQKMGHVSVANLFMPQNMQQQPGQQEQSRSSSFDEDVPPGYNENWQSSGTESNNNQRGIDQSGGRRSRRGSTSYTRLRDESGAAPKSNVAGPLAPQQQNINEQGSQPQSLPLTTETKPLLDEGSNIKSKEDTWSTMSNDSQNPDPSLNSAQSDSALSRSQSHGEPPSEDDKVLRKMPDPQDLSSGEVIDHVLVPKTDLPLTQPVPKQDILAPNTDQDATPPSSKDISEESVRYELSRSEAEGYGGNQHYGTAENMHLPAELPKASEEIGGWAADSEGDDKPTDTTPLLTDSQVRSYPEKTDLGAPIDSTIQPGHINTVDSGRDMPETQSTSMLNDNYAEQGGKSASSCEECNKTRSGEFGPGADHCTHAVVPDTKLAQQAMHETETTFEAIVG